jgi:protein-disulfide isomerase
MLVVLGAACEKKKPNDTGAVNAMDRASDGSAAQGPVDTTPLAGIDVGKLEADRQKLFYTLVGSLKSPCGKAHSLRTSFVSDTSCKRAPYAVNYVKSLLEDEVSEAEAREFYTNKYEKAGENAKFDLSKAPHIGPDDAPVRMVEFFDYECPHCALFKPVIDKVLADEGGKLVLYYMMFPIESKHPESRSAAQAALAAHAQGKFKEMHDMLFDKTPQHGKDAVAGYAKELGLDVAKFDAAYQAADTQVTLDAKQGDAAGVDSTPTLFFQDRKYEGPMNGKYIELWIEEELAVNR